GIVVTRILLEQFLEDAEILRCQLATGLGHGTSPPRRAMRTAPRGRIRLFGEVPLAPACVSLTPRQGLDACDESVRPQGRLDQGRGADLFHEVNLPPSAALSS